MNKQEIRAAVEAMDREYSAEVRALIARQAPEERFLQRACAELGGHTYSYCRDLPTLPDPDGGPYCDTCRFDYSEHLRALRKVAK